VGRREWVGAQKKMENLEQVVIQNTRDFEEIMTFGLGTRKGGVHGEDGEHEFCVCAFFCVWLQPQQGTR